MEHEADGQNLPLTIESFSFDSKSDPDSNLINPGHGHRANCVDEKCHRFLFPPVFRCASVSRTGGVIDLSEIMS